MGTDMQNRTAVLLAPIAAASEDRAVGGNDGGAHGDTAFGCGGAGFFEGDGVALL